MKILVATGNAHKVQEIREILNGEDMELLSLKEAGITADPEETGETFEENSHMKAASVAACLPPGWDGFDAVIADDSGLEVDAMGGAPGVYSARYLGEDTPHSEKRKGILGELEGLPDEQRTARFVCVVTAVFPDGSFRQSKGTMEGRIATEERGENGFGYDSIFLSEGSERTNGELSEDEKNAISHRGKAMRSMGEMLREHFRAG